MGKGSKETVLQKDMKMADKHMKRCSTFLAVREIKTKATVRYCFRATGVEVIRRQIITSVGKNSENLKPSDAAGGDIKWCNQLRNQSGNSPKG